VWGSPSSGGTGAPAGNDYTKIYSTASAFAALKADGSIKVWGDSGPPLFELPHTVIEPSALRAAKAESVE
jgi:hypothetical protein